MLRIFMQIGRILKIDAIPTYYIVIEYMDLQTAYPWRKLRDLLAINEVQRLKYPELVIFNLDEARVKNLMCERTLNHKRTDE